MNWLDEGALYSQIAVFLREDLGRGDITTQSIIARNTRARGRFVAGEKMIVAGLEAAEHHLYSRRRPRLWRAVVPGQSADSHADYRQHRQERKQHHGNERAASERAQVC